jgi:hypothetical protein
MPAAQRTADAFERFVFVELDLVVDVAEQPSLALQQEQHLRM